MLGTPATASETPFENLFGVGDPFSNFDSEPQASAQNGFFHQEGPKAPFSDSFDYRADYMQSVSKIRGAATAAAEVVASVVTKVIAEMFNQLVGIMRQAIKMAVFKFAIELCAMAIKTLVESMLNMKMTPPNIDTKGVFYNISGTGTTPINPVTSVPNQPRYDNPFGNPFSSAPGW